VTAITRCVTFGVESCPAERWPDVLASPSSRLQGSTRSWPGGLLVTLPILSFELAGRPYET